MTDQAQTVVILGAGGGIGLGFTRYFLEQTDFPVQIWATYRQPLPALTELAHHHGDRLTISPLDLTQESEISDFAQSLRSAPVRWLINCVGVLQIGGQPPEKSLRHLDMEQLQQYFAVNAIGPALVAKHFLPHFRHGQPSVLATISAKVGSIGDNHLGGWYGYRASKAALNMFIKTAAIEYKRRSPQTAVVLLHPGTTDTKLSQPFQKNVPAAKLFPVERTVGQLMKILQRLTPQDSGNFYNWDGSILPW